MASLSSGEPGAGAWRAQGAIFEAPRFYDYLSGWRNLEIYTSYSARRMPKRQKIAGRCGELWA